MRFTNFIYINPQKDYLLNYSNFEIQLQTLFYKNYAVYEIEKHCVKIK